MEDLKRRIAFLRVNERDADSLRAALPVFDSLADQFVEGFYAHLLTAEESAGFLKDPAVVERLKIAQKEHFRTMFSARWDEAYATQRREVGHVHARVGIQPNLFLGAYSQFLGFYLSRLFPVGKPVEKATADHVQSLLKGVFLDIGLSLDAYFGRLTEELHRALEMVWQANKELKQFAHFTSHDLKTPLGTVANLCEEALDEFGNQIPAEARSLIASAQQAAFRMSKMIDELLSLSVPADGEVGEEPVPLDAILKEAFERIQPELKRRGIAITFPDKNPRIVGKRIALREAFFNLLSNAVKYIEQQPGKIDVDVKVADGRCVVSVADNGPGIPPEELDRIFAAFHRVPANRAKEGSGLGLYITKSLVEQQDGRIWVDSRLGEGSCFFVSLKLAADAAQ